VFDYDFTETSACSPTIFTGCIAQFNVYDVGARKPVKLFSIPAPGGAHSLTDDIVGKSQPLAIGSGNVTLTTCFFVVQLTIRKATAAQSDRHLHARYGARPGAADWPTSPGI